MPVCSPTRASLLSGRYPFHHGAGVAVKSNHGSPVFHEFDRYPSPRFMLLPGVLEKNGIETAAIGKWHLGLEASFGGTMDSHPTDVGFSTWWGVPANMASEGGPPQANYYDYWWVENVTRSHLHVVCVTEQTAVRAQAWIAGAPEPFFLYLPLNACHAPLGGVNWPPSDHGFGSVPPPVNYKNTGFRACLENADAKIGEVLSVLGPDTLVILAGDNGTLPGALRVPNGEVRYPVGHPLYRPGDETKALSTAPHQPWKAKKSVYEGGIRVPLIVSGAGVVAPGRACDDLVDVVDLYPTIAALTGSKYPAGKLDGQDFSKLLTKANARGDRDWSYAEYFTPNGLGTPASRTIQKRAYIRRERQNLWKLIQIVQNDHGQPTKSWYEFYRVAAGKPALADPLENDDLGTSHPEFQETQRDFLELVGNG